MYYKHMHSYIVVWMVQCDCNVYALWHQFFHREIKACHDILLYSNGSMQGAERHKELPEIVVPMQIYKYLDGFPYDYFLGV